METCKKWGELKNRGSSADWSAEMRGDEEPNGFRPLSPDPTTNPVFFNAHHVYVPYCTADAHAGQVGTIDSAEWGPYYFDGHLNLKAILAHLQEQQSAMADMERMLFFGTSAGGSGVLRNCDFVADKMMQNFGAQVSCSAMASWSAPQSFVDDSEDALTSWPQWSAGQVDTLLESDPYAPLKPFLPQDCVAANQAKPWKCRFAPSIYPTMRAPVFIGQNQFDTIQFSIAELDPRNMSTCRGEEYIAYLGKTLMRSTDLIVNHPNNKKGDGLYLKSCTDHKGGTGEMDGVSTWMALDAWFTGDSSVPRIMIEECDSPEGLPCGASGQDSVCSKIAPIQGCDDISGGCLDTMTSLCAKDSVSGCSNCLKSNVQKLTIAGCTQEVAMSYCSN